MGIKKKGSKIIYMFKKVNLSKLYDDIDEIIEKDER